MIQLTSKGDIDKALFADPKDIDKIFNRPTSEFGLNPFLHKYERTLNFSTEHREVIFSSKATFNKSVECVIPRFGAFMQNIYVQINLPSITRIDGSFAAWANCLGELLLKSVSLEINGVVIDSFDSVATDVLDETEYIAKSSERGMMGKFDNLRFMQTTLQYGTDPETLFIPLRFFFTKDTTNALPLAAMTSTEMVLRIEFEEFSKCICYDGSTTPKEVDFTSANLLVEYHHVEKPFIDRFLINKPFMYLIDQIQMNEEYISGNTTQFHVDLQYQLPIRSLYWCFVDEDSENNNDWFNYLRRSDSGVIMKEAKFDFDGNEVTPMRSEMYYRLIQPNQDVISEKCIYQMHFGIKSGVNSGSVNFSRLDKASMQLNLRPGGPTRMHIIAINWNILIIQNGAATLMF